ncbi:MAG: hypothetical protein QW416_09155 [Candidatus Nitrosocaldaceae archaeon]
MYIKNFINTRSKSREPYTLTIVEANQGVYVNFVNISTKQFFSLSLYCSFNERNKQVIMKNDRYVLIIDNVTRPLAIEKLQVDMWIKQIVNALHEKSNIELDYYLTEVLYSLTYNINKVVDEYTYTPTPYT